MNIGVYKITSSSGKIYIGQSINIEKRLIDYRHKNCKGQKRLFNSIEKYGWNEHIFEVIEYCSIEELNSRERYWQEYYDVLGPNGLNCVLNNTDDKKKILSEETRNKLKTKRSKEFCELMSLKLKGRKLTEEHKLAIKNSLSKISQERSVNMRDKSKTKKVYQFNLDGTFIKEWKSNREIGRILGYDSHAISYSCNNKGTCYNFIWSFVNEINLLEIKTHGTKIVQLNKDYTEIKVWNSMKEAANILCISKYSISKCCRGKQTYAGNFIWRYYEIN
jgi:group I intron endonuclease